jgi:hypothetical protein
LGLSDEQFWHLQPRQWAALLRAWQLEQKRLDARGALVCAVIANCNRTKDSPIWGVKDFMPGEPEQEAPRRSPEEMLQTVMMLNAMHGGT